MKTQILILEDDYHKFFTTKQLITTLLKLNVTNELCAANSDEMLSHTNKFKSKNILVRSNGELLSLITKIKARKLSKLNSEITMLATTQIPASLSSRCSH